MIILILKLYRKQGKKGIEINRNSGTRELIFNFMKGIKNE